MARPTGLSPSNCAIRLRSSPSPGWMVPSSNLAISPCQRGRRSVPPTCMAASSATPMRSAQRAMPEPCISRSIGGAHGRGELRRDVALKHRRPDMIEPAFEIGPDFSAQIGPALAEREILTEIGPGLGIDHAFEQRKAIGTSGQRIERMLAKELQGRIG